MMDDHYELVSLKRAYLDLKAELARLREDLKDGEASKAALADAAVNGTVPWEQVKADLGLGAHHFGPDHKGGA
jgi:hypothetical protein